MLMRNMAKLEVPEYIFIFCNWGNTTILPVCSTVFNNTTQKLPFDLPEALQTFYSTLKSTSWIWADILTYTKSFFQKCNQSSPLPTQWRTIRLWHMIQLTFLVVGDQSFGDGLADGYKNNKTQVTWLQRYIYKYLINLSEKCSCWP